MGGGGSSSESETLVQNYTPYTTAWAGQFQVNAAAAAAQRATEQTNMAINSMRQNYADAFTALKPYTTTGIQALDELNSYLGLNPYNPGTPPKELTKPTLESIGKKLTEQDVNDYIMSHQTILPGSGGFGGGGFGVNGGASNGSAPHFIYTGAGANLIPAESASQPGSEIPGRQPVGINQIMQLWDVAPQYGGPGEVVKAIAKQRLPGETENYEAALPLYQQQKDVYDFAKEQYDKYTAAGPLTPEQVNAKLASTPGYQFQLNQGSDAIQRAASAKGLMGSGRMLQELVNYGQGLASQTYGDHLSRLAALAGAGQDAATNISQNSTSLGNNIAQLRAGLGDTLGNAALASGNALAQSWLAGRPNYQKVNLKSSTQTDGGMGGIGQMAGSLMGLFGG